MRVLTKTIKKSELQNSEFLYNGEMVKGVVDVEKGLLAVDGEMHADIEQYLLAHGSKQYDLWGINLYFDEEDEDDFIEFDSMINIRPAQNNRTRSVESPEIQDKIKEVVHQWVK